MNVLVLEDRGSVSFYMEEALRHVGHQVCSASSVPDAQSYWDPAIIDCIIVDSNMSPDGLTEQEMGETKGGLLTGWIWLRNYVFKDNEDMRQRTIIYTDYLERIEEAVAPGELDGLSLLPKKGSTSPAQQLLKEVKRVALMVEDQA